MKAPKNALYLLKILFIIKQFTYFHLLQEISCGERFQSFQGSTTANKYVKRSWQLISLALFLSTFQIFLQLGLLKEATFISSHIAGSRPKGGTLYTVRNGEGILGLVSSNTWFLRLIDIYTLSFRPRGLIIFFGTPFFPPLQVFFFY